MTDKTYKDIRVFRFRADLMIRPGLEGRCAVPTPIYNDDDRLIGFASVINEAGAIVAECAIDPSTPERLDLETGARKYYMDAALQYRGFVSIGSGFVPTIAFIQALRLTTREYPGLTYQVTEIRGQS